VCGPDAVGGTADGYVPKTGTITVSTLQSETRQQYKFNIVQGHRSNTLQHQPGAVHEPHLTKCMLRNLLRAPAPYVTLHSCLVQLQPQQGSKLPVLDNCR
jgi:hypothetical protein